MTAPKRRKAAAFAKASLPGPREAETQIRDAGPEATRNDRDDWDKVDEASDESFPASDASAKY
ncbi:hypothetical protein [Pelagibacterium lacus]|uniref:Uncharacterized protein n=1 Tax=Pelagibacterium lacus TaxID=2282655 RepID=A0A369W540_9HYPH|nr:hypothetical protein [Pelagibacterium lacus]RDE08480.1 hypothetical protein DVH29_11460 [Pelagibacterium lacus]